MKEIICDGDSWTFGCEITDPNIAKQYPKNVHPGAYDFLESNDSYRKPKIFSTHLENLLGASVTNLSWPADDNNTILRRTINYITNNYVATNKSTEDLFVIVGWSSPERNSFWYKDDKLSVLFRLWPNVRHFDALPQEEIWKLYIEYLWNKEEYLTRFVYNVMTLQNFCNAHNIKWMCYNSFYQVPNLNVDQWSDLNITEELSELRGKLGGYQYQKTNINERYSESINLLPLWETIDENRFYYKNNKNNTFKSFVEKNNPNDTFNGWHPSPTSHEVWAKELFRYINEFKLF
jgi:hypothetical protein